MPSSTSVDVKRYPGIVVGLHWLIAIMIIGLFVAGKILHGLDTGASKNLLMQMHVIGGTVVLLLALARMYFHIKGPIPADNPDQPRWMTIVSKSVHGLMGVVSILIVVSGLVTFFGYGFFDLIQAGKTAPWPATENVLPLSGHKALVFSLVLLFGAHVLGALYHQFVMKDGILSRMWFGDK